MGDVDQLGERVNGIHEVRGSIPLVSTDIPDVARRSHGEWVVHQRPLKGPGWDLGG